MSSNIYNTHRLCCVTVSSPTSAIESVNTRRVKETSCIVKTGRRQPCRIIIWQNKLGSVELWKGVNRLRWADRKQTATPDERTAESHTHQAISTNQQYSIVPHPKAKAIGGEEQTSVEYTVFRMLEAAGTAAAWPDGMPPWLLSKVASTVVQHITAFFNLSIRTSYVSPCGKLATAIRFQRCLVYREKPNLDQSISPSILCQIL